MAKPSYVAQYIPRLIAEGHTPTSALRLLRANGQSVADATFRRLWGETVDQLARKPGLSAQPLNRTISPTQVGVATRPKARGYLGMVKLAVKDQQTGEVYYKDWGFRSNKLFTPQAAIKGAMNDFIGAMKGQEDRYGLQLLSGYLDDVVEFVAPDETGVAFG